MATDIGTKCKIKGCYKTVQAKGVCGMHYGRKRRYGSYEKRENPKKARVPWIKKHVDYDKDGCLIYPFGRSPSTGYAALRLEDGSNIGAHRYMCILANGEPPTKKHLALHSCGNGHLGCVHPKHLRWGTYSDNIKDRNKHMEMRAQQVLAERFGIVWDDYTKAAA